jgi:hypothetical protein
MNNEPEVKYTLQRLEEVKDNLPHKAFIEAADAIISRFDSWESISDYEFQLATNLVVMGEK